MNAITRHKTLRKYSALTLAVLAGCIIGYFLRGMPYRQTNGHPHEIRQGGWSYINPLLECESALNMPPDAELVPFKHKVAQFIQKELDKKSTDKVAVYFRELNDGLTFRIGETDSFYPASLLKVPLLFAVLKHAEKNPGIFNKKIRYDNADLEEIQNTESGRLRLGNTYTVDELVKRMIIYSDNIPTYLLDNNIPLDVLQKTYSDLGLVNPYHRLRQPSIVLADPDYTLTAETYAAFFRILYNASYLTREQSEWALQLLGEADFKEGLVAGVPPHIKVAHKFGIHETGARGEIKQLHDCGIIYYPKRPYLLCIMTQGNSFEYLDDAIREVSHIVYQEIDRQNKIH